MIKEIIEKYKTSDDYLRWQYLSESAFDDLADDLQKYMDEEMIKFALWVHNGCWYAGNAQWGIYKETRKGIEIKYNMLGLLNYYKNQQYDNTM